VADDHVPVFGFQLDFFYVRTHLTIMYTQFPLAQNSSCVVISGTKVLRNSESVGTVTQHKTVVTSNPDLRTENPT